MSVPGQERMGDGPQIRGKVQMISGCKDEQTSGDVGDVSAFRLPAVVGPGGAGGACTNSMMQTFYKNDDTPDIPDTNMTWAQLLVEMRICLQNKRFTQVPQLSASYSMPLSTPFHVRPPNAQRTKALLIGINYVGHSRGVLSGCHNDVKVMKQFIISQGFDERNMRILMDDGQNERPTRQNIESAMRWLVSDVRPGDALFLHYSGHGSQVRDVSGDEASGMDQTMVPVDYESAGQIIDDWIFETVVLPLPAESHMFCVMDCCHSGSIMDLPYEIVVTPELAAQVQQAQQQGTLSNIGLHENPDFKKKYKKHKSVMMKMAAGAAAGAAVGTVGGPVGMCMGCMAGIAAVICCYQDEANALKDDAKRDIKDNLPPGIV